MDEFVWSNGGVILTGETEVLGEKLYTVWVVDWWKFMEHWLINTDRENRYNGRKILFSVGGRWMNAYGELWNDTDWVTEVLGEKHSILWMVDEWMSMEQLLN